MTHSTNSDAIQYALAPSCLEAQGKLPGLRGYCDGFPLRVQFDLTPVRDRAQYVIAISPVLISLAPSDCIWPSNYKKGLESPPTGSLRRQLQ